MPHGLHPRTMVRRESRRDQLDRADARGAPALIFKRLDLFGV
jgi:hypothetical protein